MIWLHPREDGIGTGIMLCLSATQFDGSDVPKIVQNLIMVEHGCIKANLSVYPRLSVMYDDDRDIVFVTLAMRQGSSMGVCDNRAFRP